jgi:hypothetical protein
MNRGRFPMKKYLTITMAIVATLLLTSCDLIDLINKIVGDTYGSPEEISILVFPPIPLPPDENHRPSDEEIKRAIKNAITFRDGLMDGANEFNRASKKTTVIPIYYTNEEPIFDFYDSVAEAMVSENNSSTKVKRICRNRINSICRNSKYKQTKCLIFGFFIHKDTATALNMMLCYYDSANDNWVQANGIVEKNPGREQNSNLQALMKTLLEKIYK